MRGRLLSAAALAAAVYAAPANADVAARYETTAENAFVDMEMTIETNDEGDVRIQQAGQPNYYLLKDSELFVISRGRTGPTVTRVADMLTIQAEQLERMGLADRFADDLPDIPRMEFVAMGTETVGSWEGTAYGFRSRSGEMPQRSVVVLSKDPRIAPLNHAMVAMQSEMRPGTGRLLGVFQQLGRDYEALLSNGTPVRMAQIDLTDVSFDPIAAERFAMPAPPLSIDELRAESSAFPGPPTLPARGD